MSINIKNLIALLCSQVASWGVTAVLLVVLPRYLGDTQFGLLSFAASFVGFFGLVAGLGTGPFLVKEIARDRSRTGLYVFNALALQVPLGLILSLCAVLLAWLVGYPARTCLIIAVTCLGMVLGALSGPLVAGLQGEQRMRRTAAWGVVQRYVGGATLVGVVLARKGVVWLALAQACVGVIGVLANGAQLIRQLRGAARLDLRLWKVLLAGGFPFLVWNIAFTIYGSIDVTMLSLMADNAVVGWYALAYKLVGVPMFLPSLVITAFFPTLSSYGAAPTPAFARLANRVLRVVFFACAPMAAGIALTAGDIIALFHYPIGFTHSIPLIRILALHIPIVGLTTVMGAVIMANDRQKQWVVVGCLASVINPALNLLAIPLTTRAFGDGAIGASIVTVGTEFFMLSGAVYLRPTGVMDRQTVGFLLRCAAACVPLLTGVAVAGSVPLPVRITLGVAVYATASLLLRTISLGELRRAGARFWPAARLGGASSAF